MGSSPSKKESIESGNHKISSDEIKKLKHTEQIDEYTIIIYPKIGGGGFGDVYRRYKTSTKEYIAAKQITLRNSKDADLAKKELESMRKIGFHKNVVQLLGYKNESKCLWIFLEFCNLGNLTEYLMKNPDITLDKKLDIMWQISCGLAYMHCGNPRIIHRDIKPENILLKDSKSGIQAKIADFGIAKVYSFTVRQTKIQVPKLYAKINKTPAGTPDYQAPELFGEDSRLMYSASVDVFSLGLVFAVLLSFGPETETTNPISVEGHQYIGCEMFTAKAEGKRLPTVVQHDESDEIILRKIKELILTMTKFNPYQRPTMNIVETKLKNTVDQVLLDFILGTKMTQEKEVTLSNQPSSLKLVHNELWSCEASSEIKVYDSELEIKRTIKTHAFSAAELDDERVVVVGHSGLHVITGKGKSVKKISSDDYNDVYVHNRTIYAARNPYKSNTIEVYNGSNYNKLDEIRTPCDKCVYHTLVVTEQHIKLCCNVTDKIYVLNKQGQLLESFGRRGSASRHDGNITPGLVKGPYLCQNDDDNTLLIADKFNNRLQLMSRRGEWSVVNVDQKMDDPIGAVWWNQKLYVSTFRDKRLAMFS